MTQVCPHWTTNTHPASRRTNLSQPLRSRPSLPQVRVAPPGNASTPLCPLISRHVNPSVPTTAPRCVLPRLEMPLCGGPYTTCPTPATDALLRRMDTAPATDALVPPSKSSSPPRGGRGGLSLPSPAGNASPSASAALPLSPSVTKPHRQVSHSLPRLERSKSSHFQARQPHRLPPLPPGTPAWKYLQPGHILSLPGSPTTPPPAKNFF